MAEALIGSQVSGGSLMHAVERLRRRARCLRAERSASLGLAAGLGLGVLLRGFELMHVFAVATSWYVAAALAPALAAWGWAFLHPPGIPEVAQAADARLGAKDRTASAIALSGLSDPMTAALVDDAAQHIAGVAPSQVFRRRWRGRAGPPAAAAVALALAVLLPQWPALQSAQARAAHDERREKAAQLERLAADIEKRADPQTKDLAKQVAENLRNLGRDLRSPMMTEKKALARMKQTAAQLAAAKAKIEQTDGHRPLEQAGGELTRLADRDAIARQGERLRDLRELGQLKQAGLKDLETLEQAAKLDAADLQKLANLPQLRGLTQEQVRRLAELAKRARARQTYQNLGMPQELLDALSELFAKEDYLKALEVMQDLMDKLRDRLEAQQRGEAPKLTPEELQRLQADFKKLAEQLRNTNLDELAKQLRELAEQLSKMDTEELLKRLKACKGCCKKCGVGLGLLPGLSACIGACGGGGFGRGIGPGDSVSRYVPGLEDRPTGTPQRAAVPLSDVNIQGQFGDKGDVAASEIYVPPSARGGPGKVPYFRVLPSYRDQAEDALRREEVPPEHKARVKRYFDSLASQ